MGIPEVAIVEPISVPKDLICHICLDLADNPVVTSCSHIFCSNCLQSSRQQSNSCPVDRVPLGSTRQIKDSSPILYRIWNSIALRCPHAHSRSCIWTGTASGYSEHLSTCARINPSASANTTNQLNNLKKEVSDLKAAHETLNRSSMQERARLSEQVTELSNSLDVSRCRNESLRNEISRMSAELHHNELELASLAREREELDTSYRYDIYKIKKLATLIFQNLYDKPYHINQNKIFSCIESIYKGRRLFIYVCICM